MGPIVGLGIAVAVALGAYFSYRAKVADKGPPKGPHTDKKSVDKSVKGGGTEPKLDAEVKEGEKVAAEVVDKIKDWIGAFNPGGSPDQPADPVPDPNAATIDPVEGSYYQTRGAWTLTQISNIVFDTYQGWKGIRDHALNSWMAQIDAGYGDGSKTLRLAKGYSQKWQGSWIGGQPSAVFGVLYIPRRTEIGL